MIKTKQEQFLELYEPIHDRFERFCRARVYGDMDYRDLMNETLLVAFSGFDRLRSKKAFLSFLFGISVRIIGNHQQKRRTERFSEDEVIKNIRDLNANAQKDADIHFLHEALAKLSEDQRECLILFEITGFSIKEIMEIQGSSESAIKQRLKRGRVKLQEILTYEANLQTGEVNNG